MTADDLDAYLRALGLTVEAAIGNGVPYSVIREFTIPHGGLRGRVCDIALQRVTTVPYVPPAAIQTRPALVRMDSGEPLGTQTSPLGPDWQYWSRRFDHQATPHALWAHVLTVLCDLRWQSE